MKPLPAPNVPGNTEAERFDNAVHAMFNTSKQDVLKEEAKRKKARTRARQKRARAPKPV